MHTDVVIHEVLHFLCFWDFLELMVWSKLTFRGTCETLRMHTNRMIRQMLYFLSFWLPWTVDIENAHICIEVWPKWGYTPLELSKILISLQKCDKSEAGHRWSYSKSIKISLVLWWFWKLDFKNVNISWDLWIITWVSHRWSYSKSMTIPYVVWIFWKLNFKNVNISLDQWPKWAPKRWSYSKNEYGWGRRALFEIPKSQMLKYHWFYIIFERGHRWRQTPAMKFASTCSLFKAY